MPMFALLPLLGWSILLLAGAAGAYFCTRRQIPAVAAYGTIALIWRIFSPLSLSITAGQLAIIASLYLFITALARNPIRDGGTQPVTLAIVKDIITVVLVAGMGMVAGLGIGPAVAIGLAVIASSNSLTRMRGGIRSTDHAVSEQTAQSISAVDGRMLLVSLTVIAGWPGVYAVVRGLAVLGIFYVLGRPIPRNMTIPRDIAAIAVTGLMGIVMTILLAASIPFPVATAIAGVVTARGLAEYQADLDLAAIESLAAVSYVIAIILSIPVMTMRSIAVGLALAVCIMVVKFLASLTAGLLVKLHSRSAYGTAVRIVGISEVAIVIFSYLHASRLLSPGLYSDLCFMVIFSLMSTPYWIDIGERSYGAVRSAVRRYIPSFELFLKSRSDSGHISIPDRGWNNHVIVCGYDRVGSTICRLMQLAKIPVLLIDLSPVAIEEARRSGIETQYGDPADDEQLRLAEVKEASAVVITATDVASHEAIILQARKLHAKAYIISILPEIEGTQRLHDLGADSVIHIGSEAALSAVRRIFAVKRLPKQDIINKIRHFRMEQGGI